jgi:hypothetical protein
VKKVAVLITAGLVVATSIPVQLHAGWIRTYGRSGDGGYAVQQTTDGGYIIVGLRDFESNMTQSFASLGRQDLWLLKTDSEGDTLWTRIYGGDGGQYDQDKGNFVQETLDGGYIVVGTKDCIAEEYGSYIWLLKTDVSGDTLWTRTYHSEARSGWNSGVCVGQTQDSGYILTGSSSLPNEGCEGLSLIKTDTNGDTMWTHLYWGESSACGTSGTSVQQTSDGGYIVTGSLAVPKACVGWASTASWLLKTDEHGDTLWTRTYKTPANLTTANCLDQTADGGYILLGMASGSSSYIGLVKTDADGDTLWTRTFGEYGGSAEGNCVHQTLDRGYIITGHMDNDLCLIKTDSLGYVSVAEEPPVTPVTHPSDCQISASIGPQITIRYTNHPQGFHAQVFDASGRKVDELHSSQPSGTITWPIIPATPVTSVTHQSPGVYFIRSESDRSALARKVILIR